VKHASVVEYAELPVLSAQSWLVDRFFFFFSTINGKRENCSYIKHQRLPLFQENSSSWNNSPRKSMR